MNGRPPATDARPGPATVFDRAYEATPSWEIGGPQPAVLRLADAGRIEGRVLEVGCGTGENALELARRGLTVTGIDIAAVAIERARRKAAARALTVELLVLDAFELDGLGRRFDTILDVGLLHVLQPAERRPYADRLRSALGPGGRCLVLCWSDRNPFGVGPARVRRQDLRAAFAHGWRVEAIQPETLDTRLDLRRAKAWLARVRAT